jgi:hypothetical protein
MISIQPATSRHFGADEPPFCAKCIRPMNITRRSPHPVYGHDYELQTFECRVCNREVQRSADCRGFPHKSVEIDVVPSSPRD